LPEALARKAAPSGKLDPSPHDLEAEAAVLSAVALSSAALDVVRDLVEPVDFYSGPHRAVFEAVLALDDAAAAIDVVTIAAQLRSAGKLQLIGGTAFLAGLVDATPTVANVAEHARLVRSLGVLRRMGTTLRELSILASAPETRAGVPSFLEQCEARVFAANAAGSERETGGTLHSVMGEAIVSLDPTRPRDPRGVTTGLHELDELTMGLIPGELWYLAARPGMGKTALALGIAQAAARTGRHVIFFSLEMKRAELGERMISAASGVPYKALQKRELSADQWSKATTAMADLGQLPIFVDDGAVLSPARLRSRVRRHASVLRQRHQIGRVALVVVDYVQLMTGDDRERNRNDELERISRALKLLAGEFGCTVLALSQLKRPDGKGGGGRPGLSDLRGSGALEQDADKVLMVHRDDESDGDERGDAELILAKGRNAGRGRVAVIWQPWYVRFVDASQAGFAWAPSGDDPNPSGAGY